MTDRARRRGVGILAFALIFLFLAGVKSPLLAQDEATLEGKVTDLITHRPMGMVEIKIPDLDMSIFTNEDGSYRLKGIPAGEYRLRFEFIGYGSEVDTVSISQGEVTRHNVNLRPKAIKLSELRVQVESEGFIAELLRRRSDNEGHFITHAELMEEKPTRLTDMLRQFSDIRVRFDPDKGYFVEAGGCEPYLIVNGTHHHYWRLNDFEPEHVLAIEIYKRHYNIPKEYKNLFSDCGAILIWTMDQ